MKEKVEWNLMLNTVINRRDQGHSHFLSEVFLEFMCLQIEYNCTCYNLFTKSI